MGVQRILITGGAGFIGSNLVHFLQRQNMSLSQDIQITVLDALTYAGSLSNLDDIPNPKSFKFVHGDVRDWEIVKTLVSSHDVIYHLAAESHVDRSITSPGVFVETNVQGTLNLLEACRQFSKRLVLVSTDEVYGSLSEGFATEEFPLKPSSPYSASKASADLLALAYHKTYGIDVVITRCTNNYGPRQFPEKLIPQSIIKIFQNKKIPIYGTGLNVRDWIHVDDHCLGLSLAMDKGRSGKIYNFGNVDVLTNLEVINLLLSSLSASKELIEFVEDRLGHDFRYAVDSSLAARELGWKPVHSFAESIIAIVDWYKLRF
jgi:dTDP-glucose 4,6-dehydratase